MKLNTAHVLFINKFFNDKGDTVLAGSPLCFDLNSMTYVISTITTHVEGYNLENINNVE
jgi:hypothetical protein